MKYHTLFFFQKLGKISPNLSSAAVVIGALRVKTFLAKLKCIFLLLLLFRNAISVKQLGSRSDLAQNCLKGLSADDKSTCSH